MKKKIGALLVLMLVGLLITGCGGSTDDSRSSGTTTKVTATAKVVDSETEKIITDAEVKMDGKEGEGEEGVYQFKVEANKEHTFTANAPDYVKTEKTVKVKEEDMTVKIKLAKQDKVLNGTVMNKNEEPIKGVTVTVKDTEKSKTTGENGKFKFEDLEEGNYTLVFEHKLYKTKEKQIKFEFDKNNNLQINLEASNPNSSSLTIEVLDSYTEDPVVNAEVIVDETEHSTNGEGKVNIDNLGQGIYSVNISDEDYKSIEKDSFEVDLGLSEDKQITHKLEPKPAKISGIVTDQDERVLTGIIVKLTKPDAEEVVSKQYSNGVEGFSFDNLNPGEYIVKFRHVDYKDKDVTVKLGPNDHKQFDPVKLAEKKGTITGNIPEGATVRIMETGQESTDTNFEFTRLNEGEYTVAVRKDGYHPQVHKIDINGGETADIGNISLDKAPSINGIESFRTVTAGTDQIKVISSIKEKEVIEIEQSDYKIDYFLHAASITEKSGIKTFKSSSDFQYPEVYIKNNDDQYIEDISLGMIGMDRTVEGSITNFSKSPFELGIRANIDKKVRLILYGEVKIFYDNESPRVNVNQKWGHDYSFSINLDIVEKGKGLKYAKFAVASTLLEPSSYEEFSSSKDVKISNSGTYYLHVRAKDKMGNETYRIFGPYVVK